MFPSTVPACIMLLFVTEYVAFHGVIPRIDSVGGAVREIINLGTSLNLSEDVHGLLVWMMFNGVWWIEGIWVAVNPFPKLNLENKWSIRFLGSTGNSWRHKSTWEWECCEWVGSGWDFGDVEWTPIFLLCLMVLSFSPEIYCFLFNGFIVYPKRVHIQHVLL